MRVVPGTIIPKSERVLMMISKRIPLLQPGDNFYKDYLIRKSKSNYGHICFKDGKISIPYKSYMHVTNAIDKNAVKWVE